MRLPGWSGYECHLIKGEDTSRKDWFWTVLVFLGLVWALFYPTKASATGNDLNAQPVVATDTTQVTAAAGVAGANQKAGLWLNYANTLAFSSVYVATGKHVIINVNASVCADIEVQPGSWSGVLVPLGSMNEWISFKAKYSSSPGSHVIARDCGAACNNGAFPLNSVLCTGADQNIPAAIPPNRVVASCNPTPSYLDKCTFQCTEYAYFNAGACTAYVCTGGDPANATPCIALTSPVKGGDRAKTVLGSCPVLPDDAACMFLCNSTFHQSGNTCVANTCAALPGNASVCNNKQPVVNGAGQVYEANPCDNTSQACRFQCVGTYHWNGSACVGNTCAALPANATSCNANYPASDGTAYSYTASCGSAPCTYTCATYYHWTGAACVGNTCAALPANATSCNANYPASDGTAYSYTALCGATACTYNCAANYHWTGAACVANTCAALPGNATSCNANYPASDGTAYSYTASCGAAACTYTCAANYHWTGAACVANTCAALPANGSSCNANLPAADGTAYSYTASCGVAACTYTCAANTHWTGAACAVNTCSGSAPGNATSCNANIPAVNNTAYSYTAFCGVTACTFNCNGGYTWNGSACVANNCVALPANGSSCNANLPAVNNTAYSYTASCGATACTFNCNSGYTWNGSACAANTCSGSVPTNAASCNANLPAVNGTAYSNVASCGSTACTFACNSSYSWNGSSCAAACIPWNQYNLSCAGDADCCSPGICVFGKIGGFYHFGCLNIMPPVCNSPGGYCDSGSTFCCYPYTCSNQSGGGGTCQGASVCSGGTPCGTFPSCTAPVCSSNAACDDGNPCTTDTCNNAGTCSSSCSHTNKANGTTCNAGLGGNSCNDTCQNGVCITGADCFPNNTTGCYGGDGCYCASDRVCHGCCQTESAYYTAQGYAFLRAGHSDDLTQPSCVGGGSLLQVGGDCGNTCWFGWACNYDGK